MGTESGLTSSKQVVDIGAIQKRKPGRPPMTPDRRQGKRPKGFHLPTDVCEMLSQLSIVDEPNESFHVAQAVMDYFAKKKQYYLSTFGVDHWTNCLDAAGHIDRLKNRRKRLA